MRLFLFWPVLVLLSVPDTVMLYWEPGAQSYETEVECAEKLQVVEEMAGKDWSFLEAARMLNHGEQPPLTFSRECATVPPREFMEELRRRRPGSST